MKPTLDEFINGQGGRSPKNSYVRFPGFGCLYVRCTKRYLQNKIVSPVFDIANIEATRPGNGAFTKLFAHLRKDYPEMWLFVECVANERFAKKLLAMGFTQCTNDILPSFYMAPAKEEPHEVHRHNEEPRRA